MVRDPGAGVAASRLRGGLAGGGATASIMALAAIDSFLIDPLLLLLCGAIIRWVCVRHLYHVSQCRCWIPMLSVFTMVIFWGVSMSLYFDAAWVAPMWQMLGAPSGRDFMINSLVFSFDTTNLPDWAHVVCGIQFAIYPLWLWLGLCVGGILFGHNERQTGVMGALRSVEQRGQAHTPKTAQETA